MLLGRALRSRRLLLLALLGVTRPSFAEDDAVRVHCDALTPDDGAQVEARLRATLLTAAQGTTSVRIDCDANIATVRILAGEHTEAAEVVLPADNPREPLLAAIERLLVTLEEQSRGTAEPAQRAAADSPSVAPKSSAPPSVAVALPPVAQPTTSRRPAPALPATSHWDVGAGATGELWDGALAYGARLHAERRQSAWSIGAAAAWLTTSAVTDVFRPNEFHGFVFGALEEPRTGLRGSLGVGASTLRIRTQPGVVALTPTALSVVLFDVEVARPVRFGRVWLLPAFELRIFPAAREVTVDAERRLALPPVCPGVFLGVGYTI